MYNDIAKIGPITIHGYGLMIAIGVLCALIVSVRRARRKDLDIDIIYRLGFVALASGFIGAKLLFCIVEAKALLNDPGLILSGNGFVVYGGIIGGISGALIYCRFKKVGFLQYFDLIMPAVALAQGFGRIGCFLAGCCYGRETDSVIGVIFHNSSYAPNEVKIIPTQLLLSAGDFLIAIALMLYGKRARNAGTIGALYLILISTMRFVMEFFRNDYRGSIGALSTSQFISLIILAVGVGMFIMRNKLNLLLGEQNA